MNIPHDISGQQLAKALSRLGYATTRQKGSHIRLTTELNGVHHITIPDHRCLRDGTLRGILKDVAEHHGVGLPELLELLDF
jgi:predicted RNA binding protein YcfA (HicA-like mRNA interferase family)